MNVTNSIVKNVCEPDIHCITQCPFYQTSRERALSDLGAKNSLKNPLGTLFYPFDAVNRQSSFPFLNEYLGGLV